MNPVRSIRNHTCVCSQSHISKARCGAPAPEWMTYFRPGPPARSAKRGVGKRTKNDDWSALEDDFRTFLFDAATQPDYVGLRLMSQIQNEFSLCADSRKQIRVRRRCETQLGTHRTRIPGLKSETRGTRIGHVFQTWATRHRRKIPAGMIVIRPPKLKFYFRSVPACRYPGHQERGTAAPIICGGFIMLLWDRGHRRICISGQNHTLHAQTARPSDLSRPLCASGHTQNTGPTPSKETLTCSLGPTTTTMKDPMVASTTSRPSAAPIPEQPLDHLQPPALLRLINLPCSAMPYPNTPSAG